MGERGEERGDVMVKKQAAEQRVVQARGSTLRSTLDFITAEKGDAALRRILARLPQSDRALIERTSPTDEVPFSLVSRLWREAERELGGDDPTWMERAGAYAIERMGMQLYGGLLRKSTPHEFLTQGISLFRLYYHPGDMEVVEEADDRAVLRLVGFDAEDRDQLFCRRQNGGLERALAIAGGKDPRVRHVRCALEGDAFCEWEGRWG